MGPVKRAVLLANKIAAVFLVIGMVLQNFAAQAKELPPPYAEIGWWVIDYLEEAVGCQATALFKGQTSCT